MFERIKAWLTHTHNWVILDHYKFSAEFTSDKFIYVMRCTDCGKLKKFKVRP